MAADAALLLATRARSLRGRSPRSETWDDKVVAIVFPISVFVAAGFEQSVGNMCLIPLAILLQEWGDVQHAGVAITWTGFMRSMAPVLLGNIVGGSLLVGLVYYLIYRKPPTRNGGM